MEMATLSIRHHGGDDDANDADRQDVMDDGSPADENRTTTTAAGAGAGALGPAESSEASGGSGRRGKAKRDDDGHRHHDGMSTMPPPRKCAAIGDSRSPPPPQSAVSLDPTDRSLSVGGDRGGGVERERPLLAVTTSPPAARGAIRRRDGDDEVCDDERETGERHDDDSPSPPLSADFVAAQMEAAAQIRAITARYREEGERKRLGLGRGEEAMATPAAAEAVAVDCSTEDAINRHSNPASSSGSTSASASTMAATARTRRRPEPHIDGPIRGSAGSSPGDVGTDTTDASVGEDEEEQQPAKRRRGGGDGANEEESRPETIEVPEQYNGRRMAKYYDGVPYFGTVTICYSDNTEAECYCHIDYDDGEMEDFYLSDLMECLDLYAREKDKDPHRLSTSDESVAGEASESSIGRGDNPGDGGRDVGRGDSSVEHQDGVGADPADEEDESANVGRTEGGDGTDDGTPPPSPQCCAICFEEDRGGGDDDDFVGGRKLVALPCCGGGSDYHEDHHSERRPPATPDRELASSTRFCRECIARHADENGVGYVRNSGADCTMVVECPRCRGLLHVSYGRSRRSRLDGAGTLWRRVTRTDLRRLSRANFRQSATYAVRRSEGSRRRALRLVSRVYPHFVPLELFVATARGNRVRGRDDAEALVRWGILDRGGGDDAVYRIDPERQRSLREEWNDYGRLRHLDDRYNDADDGGDEDDGVDEDDDGPDSQHRADRRSTSSTWNSTRLFRLLLREAARATGGNDDDEDEDGDDDDGGHAGGGPPSDFVLAGDVFAAGLEAFAACRFVTALRLFNQTCTIHLRSDNFFSPAVAGGAMRMTSTHSTEFRREWHGWLVSALNVVLLLLFGHLLVVTVLHLMLYYSIVRAVGWAVSTSSTTQRRPGRGDRSGDALRAFVRGVPIAAAVVVGGGRLWHLVMMLPHVPNAFHLWR